MNDDLLAAVAAEHGTPCYVYDLDAIAGRVDRLRAALPEGVRVAFAVKANPLPAVLERLVALGLGFDVASAGELSACLTAGARPSAIVFTGPGKGDAELAAAVAAGIGAVTVESPGELLRLERLAAAAGRRVDLLLRADNPPGDDGQVIGDGAGKFGMRDEDLMAAAGLAARSPWLRLVGIHRFGASNVTAASALLAHARRTADLAARVAAVAGVPLRIVDVGGGLGIPYRDGDPELDLELLGTGLARVVAELRRDPRLAGAALLLEPGRWLVGPAGAYLARVVDVKRTAGDRWVAIADGGIHHLLRPALVGEARRPRLVGVPAAARPSVRVSVAGPLCTGLDVLARDAPLPLPAVGDLLVVGDAGAYGFTESMPFFLSHPTPAEVVVSGGLARVARARLRLWLMADPMHGQHPIVPSVRLRLGQHQG